MLVVLHKCFGNTECPLLEHIYQPGDNVWRDNYVDTLADSHSILNRRKNRFCQLLHVYGIKILGRPEIHKLVPIAGAFEFEMVIQKIKIHNFVSHTERRM
jgi:hypothetical protein